ncbi:MAG: GIY-YIG nuclease family protein [Firmicutes bacterium]|nr:GIY-YIG nuclease family protein [Bacillota bacterium]
MIREEQLWWVYVLRCGDGTFYTGITKDIRMRLAAHAAGRGARYTRGRGPFTIWWLDGPLAHGEALRRERRVKQLTHREKMALRGSQHGRPV